jgi:hypothetical protein
MVIICGRLVPFSMSIHEFFHPPPAMTSSRRGVIYHALVVCLSCPSQDVIHHALVVCLSCPSQGVINHALVFCLPCPSQGVINHAPTGFPISIFKIHPSATRLSI